MAAERRRGHHTAARGQTVQEGTLTAAVTQFGPLPGPDEPIAALQNQDGGAVEACRSPKYTPLLGLPWSHALAVRHAALYTVCRSRRSAGAGGSGAGGFGSLGLRLDGGQWWAASQRGQQPYRRVRAGLPPGSAPRCLRLSVSSYIVLRLEPINVVERPVTKRLAVIRNRVWCSGALRDFICLLACRLRCQCARRSLQLWCKERSSHRQRVEPQCPAAGRDVCGFTCARASACSSGCHPSMPGCQ